MNIDDENQTAEQPTMQPIGSPGIVSQINAYVEGSQNVAIGEQITQIIGLSAEDVKRLLQDFVRSQRQRTWDGRRPYIGLDAFTEQSAEFFFGREQLVTTLLDSLKSAPFVAVAGPSGSGKSSLVQAGLIHALRQGQIDSSQGWHIVTMTPRGQPIEQLALSMARLAENPAAAEYIRTAGHTRSTALLDQAETLLSAAPGQRLLLFVDQFEELFTQTRSDEERRAFLDLLAKAATSPASRVIIVIAMRSDFLSHAAAYAELREQINRSFHLVGAMDSVELAKAIALPALAVGAEIEPDLVAQVIADMRGEPGALPLMQFALKDLFDATARQPGAAVTLTRSDYLARGGIFEALERYADGVFDKLNAEQQAAARQIYTHLIEVGRGTLDTRRTADLREIAGGAQDAAQAEAIIQMLANARLVTTDAAADGSLRTVTIAHEKLIEAWPWLRRLVSENREAIALLNDIADDAQRWDASGRDFSYLYSGARLATVREQVEAKTIVLAGLATEFIAAATAEREAKRAAERAAQVREIQQAQALAEEQRLRAETEEKAAQRLQRRNRWLMVAFAGAMAALLLAIFFFVRSRASELEAQRQAVLARAGELAASSALEAQTGDMTRALLMGTEALSLTLATGLTEPPLIRNGLRTSLWAYRGLGIDGPWPATPTRLTVSHRGDLRAVGSEDGMVRVTPITAGGSTSFTVQLPGRVDAIAFRPDDRQIAIASSSGARSQIVFADIATRSIVKRIASDQARWLFMVSELAYSPDGRQLAMVGQSSVAYLLDVESDQKRQLAGHGGPQLYGLAFSADGHYLATSGADRTVRIWQTADGALVQTLEIDENMADDDWTTGLIFMRDDQWLVAATAGFLNLWQRNNSDDGSVSYEHRWTERGHADTIGRLVGDRSGHCLATVSFAQGVSVWRPSAGAAGRQWSLPVRNAIDAAFWNSTGAYEPVTACSNRLLTAGADALLRTWNTGLSREVATVDPGHGRIRAVRFAPGSASSQLLVGADDGSLSLFDLAAGKVVTTIAAHDGPLQAMALTVDGALLATAGADGDVKLWQVPALALLCEHPALHTGAINAAVFDQAGRRLLTTGDDRRAVITDGRDCRTILWEQTTSELLKGAVFLHDGEQIVVAGEHYLRSWSGGEMQAQPQVLHGHNPATGLIPLADGQFLSIGSGRTAEERTPRIWRMAPDSAPALVRQVDGIHSNNVYAADVHPARPEVLSGGRDDTVDLWDHITVQEADNLAGFRGEVLAIDIAPDGHYAAVAGDEGVIRIYALDAVALLHEARSRIETTLTAEDCRHNDSALCSSSPDVTIQESSTISVQVLVKGSHR